MIIFFPSAKAVTEKKLSIRIRISARDNSLFMVFFLHFFLLVSAEYFILEAAEADSPPLASFLLAASLLLCDGSQGSRFLAHLYAAMVKIGVGL